MSEQTIYFDTDDVEIDGNGWNVVDEGSVAARFPTSEAAIAYCKSAGLPWKLTYPEHDKLRLISDKSQAIGEFIDWLNDAKRIHLAEYLTDDDDSTQLVTIITPITKLLAEFFEIDQDKIEAEKRAMLDALREANS